MRIYGNYLSVILAVRDVMVGTPAIVTIETTLHKAQACFATKKVKKAPKGVFELSPVIVAGETTLRKLFLPHKKLPSCNSRIVVKRHPKSVLVDTCHIVTEGTTLCKLENARF